MHKGKIIRALYAKNKGPIVFLVIKVLQNQNNDPEVQMRQNNCLARCHKDCVDEPCATEKTEKNNRHIIFCVMVSLKSPYKKFRHFDPL